MPSARPRRPPSRLVAPLLGVALAACDDAAGGGGGTEIPTRDAFTARPVADARVADVLPLSDARPDAAPPDAAVECRLNSDCAPGLYCRAGRCAFDCRVDRDCAAGERCESGECVAGGSECRGDGDCGPPARVCVEGACVPGCGAAGCAAGERCEAATGRCVPGEPDLECRRDADCGLRARCDAATGRCVPEAGCGAGDCGPGERCDEATGRCVPDGPPDCRVDGCGPAERCDEATGACVAAGGALGHVCAEDADCDSGLCLAVGIGARVERICTALCCSERHCPPGFGCLYVAGVRYCLPGRFNLAGDGFTAEMGQACGAGGNNCRSGLCDVGRDRCLGACCTDADCLGRLCFWGATQGGNRTFCDIPLGLGRTGELCFNELDCASGVCIPTGAEPPQPPGQCADLCCKNADCPGAYVCGQVLGPERSLVTACVPLPRGQRPEGEPCADGAECASGLCIEGACAEPCCFDVDCRGAARCRPRDNGEGGRVRVCVR